MGSLENFIDSFFEQPIDSTTVVKLETKYYKSGIRSYCSKSLRRLTKKSSNDYDLLNDEIGAIGVDEVLSSIENLFEVPDGEYYLVICEKVKCRETGECLHYTSILKPYKG